MKEYVAGYAFNEERTQVVLIQKNRPDWQKGCLNGVGGKVEEGELPLEAMMREFFEETGVQTFPSEWNHFSNLIWEDDVMGGKAIVYCFRMFSDKMLDCKTMTDERIVHFDLNDHSLEVQVVRAVNYLLPIAEDKEFVKFCSFDLI
jgi:8-oxo-dGTP diphosphatase